MSAVPAHRARAELLRALGHPVRIRVLELLFERDHAVRELLAQIEVEQTGLCQQLAVLRRTGMVRQQRIGGEVVSSLTVLEARDMLLSARRLLAELGRNSQEFTSQVQAGPSWSEPARRNPGARGRHPACGR